MKHRIMKLSATLATMSLFGLTVTSAQITETKLLPSDGIWGDIFGCSVSVSGNYAIVGAIGDDDNGASAGSAYIYHHDGESWVEHSKLLASDGGAYEYFGRSVSISGDYALVGAHFADSFTGSAYVFHREGAGWVQQAILIPGDGAQRGWFGKSVSVSGTYALVGAPEDEENGEESGAAYVFHYDGSNWIQHVKLLGEVHDRFGGSVSISGDYALIGADDNGNDAGAAYTFHFDGSNWVQQSKLIASDGIERDYFGISVSLSGDYALVGANKNDERGTNAGAAYIFHFNGSNWTEQTKLTASDGIPDDAFGVSVSLSNNYALIGADGGNGSAYIFHYDGSTWLEQTKLIGSDGSAGDHFGQSVSLSGDYALVGAPHDSDIGGSAGSAYVYTATSVCSKVSQFQARCRPGGLIKARVTMADASHEGKIIEISIDDVPYEVTIDATGRGQLSQSGFSPGPHTVELTNPGQCFDPIIVTCRTSLDEEASDDWDDELVSETPTETALLGNYPNPFNPSTTIRYTLSNDGAVSIRVYNMLGQEVAALADGFQKAGEQSVTWNGTNNFGQSVASGLYIYRLQAGSVVMSQKMLFTK